MVDEAVVESSLPGSGASNLTVLNTTYLNGTQTFDDLYVGCGIASCGSIVATGDLILSVNTLTVMSGASIIAYDQPTNTQGVGGSVQMSNSYIGDGGGGAVAGRRLRSGGSAEGSPGLALRLLPEAWRDGQLLRPAGTRAERLRGRHCDEAPPAGGQRGHPGPNDTFQLLRRRHRPAPDGPEAHRGGPARGCTLWH